MSLLSKIRGIQILNNSKKVGSEKKFGFGQTKGGEIFKYRGGGTQLLKSNFGIDKDKNRKLSIEKLA